MKWVVFAVTLVVFASAVAATASSEEASEASTPQQKAERARQYVEQMQLKVDETVALQEQARRTGDMTKVTAIGDILTAMRGLVQVAERALTRLEQAVVDGQVDVVEREYVKIVIAYNKVIELDAEAKSAGGPELLGTVDGRPIIERTVEPELQEVATTDIAPPLEVFVERPDTASPVD